MRPASATRMYEPVENAIRVTWVDTAKGYGIILVVFAHAVRGLIASDIMTWTPVSRFVDAWIYAFHMPLFFVLSGLFLVRSAERPWGAFVSDKLRTIAYPYFVWSVITVLIKAALGPLANQPKSLSDLALIFYAPIDQYWFLYVLFVLLIAASALLKLRVWPWAIFVLAILIYPGLLPISSGGWDILAMARDMAIYVALGLIVGWRSLGMISGVHAGWLASGVVAGLTVASLAGLSELPHMYALQPVFAVSGTVAVVALAVLTDKTKLSAAIQFLGRHSLEIYLAHTMASAAVRITLIKLAHVSEPVPHLVLGTLAGLYIPIAMVFLFGRVGFRFGFTLPKLRLA